MNKTDRIRLIRIKRAFDRLALPKDDRVNGAIRYANEMKYIKPIMIAALVSMIDQENEDDCINRLEKEIFSLPKDSLV